jgi:hypothetical protein
MMVHLLDTPVFRCLRTLLLTFALAGLLPRTSALAHPDLDDAKRLAADLEFDAALGSFEKALKSDTLTREELVLLLAERVLVLHALHRKEALVQDFVWLSALAPDHRLDLRAPPDLTALWTSVRDQGRGLLKVELVAEAKPSGLLEARANLTGTVPEGARARLWLKRGAGNFVALPLPELHESAEAGTRVELYAQAVGLGNIVLDQAHAPNDPLRLVASETDASGANSGRSEREPSWAKRHKGWLIGGAVVLATAAIVTGVVLATTGDSGRSDQTTLKPMLEW